MRLIDADKCPCFKCARTSNRPCPVWLCDSWCSWLQEIAYDVDKVVEEINEESWEYMSDFPNSSVIGRDDAIDIVKRGGIDEG